MDIDAKSHHELAEALKAIDHVQGVIWFTPDGKILEANENFCAVVGYRPDEIVGQHHRIFCEPTYASGPEYAGFWSRLARGESVNEKVKRVRKGGEAIYLEASYTPIRSPAGMVEKVVKFAVDVTEATKREALFLSKLDAITLALGVIEFELDGTVRWANRNFLDAMGYSLEEIKGRHHRMFCDPTYAASPDYEQFWRNLRAGGNEIGEFQRFGKNGREVWIHAGYNAIKDPEGKVYRILKYASDITGSKVASRHIERGLQAVSEGDLSYRVPDDVRGEFGVLREAFNTTMVRLEDLVTGILESSAAISSESAAIAATANDLSSRCEQQAATVEQTSAAMEEMSATVRSNATNAESATEAARKARSHAENGGKIVTDAIAAMERIKAGSAEVRKIISVIDSIAFQTNLLALNAGVEAARAGDAGRGFAVVASEVRALAQRASDSARDINALIETSGKEVADGASLVVKTGEALTEIVAAVANASEGIESIFVASREQATGVAEVNQAISSIDGSTQQTAAIAEESAAAAATLANSANDLQDLVSFFQKENPDVQAAAPWSSHSRATGSSERVAVNGGPAAARRAGNERGWNSY